MKKMYKYILIITLMMFGFIGEVRANDELNGCVDAGTCELLCSYKSDDGNAYIYKMNKSYDGEKTTFVASYSWNKGKVNEAYIFNGAMSYVNDTGSYKSYNANFGLNAYSFIDESLIESYDNFTCPQKVYKNDSAGEEVCFDNDDGYCKGIGVTELPDWLGGAEIGIQKFKKAISNVEIISEKKDGIKDTKLTAKKAKKKIQKYFDNNNDKSEIIEVCVFNNDETVEGDADQKFVVTLKNKFRYFSYRNTNGVESFGEIVEKTNVTASGTSSNTIDINYNIWVGSCLGMSDIFSYTLIEGKSTINGLTDKNPVTAQLKTVYSTDGKPFNSQSGEDEPAGTGDDPNEPEKCEDLLGDNLRNEINSYLLYIKVAVPIIIIVMGSLDFGKAFISSDEDSMKKAQKKFIMRLIIGMVIFFLPALINILLNIANQVWGFSKGTCGITF